MCQTKEGRSIVHSVYTKKREKNITCLNVFYLMYFVTGSGEGLGFSGTGVTGCGLTATGTGS